MRLRIEEIRYKNIREFGDLHLDFTRDGSNEVHHISLVQMPNGTGKTTTMQLVRHLILGDELEENEVLKYEPEFGASEGEFTIGFTTSSERFRVHMHFDYDMGTVDYRHSYPQREGGGINSGHFLPMEFENTLTKAFVDLFVFNGELTEEFIETGEDKAETALKIVNQLDRIEAQRATIERIIEKRQEERGTKTEQGLKQAKTKLDKRRRKLSELKRKRDKLNKQIENHDENINKYQDEREEIIAQEGDVLEEYKEYEEEIKKLETDLNTKSSTLLKDMRRPSKLSENFTEDFEELLTHMTVLKLPKSTSEEFFNELAEGDTCICGRDLDEKHRDAIRQNAEDYLSDEDIGVLNALKEQLRNISDPDDFESRLSALAETRKELKQYEMKQDQLDLEDPELEEKKQKLTQQIESEKSDMENKQRKVEFLTTDDKGMRENYNLSWKKNIPEAKREVNKYEEKLQKATGTVTLKKQAETLDEIFEEFVSRCTEDLKQRQIAKTNERLSRILKLSEVQIESIDDSIKLEGKEGSSEGQALAVAYAYLSTLFEDSEIDMPFVVDSPAVSLDHKVRREVAVTISELFDQLIGFVISTEKEGFVENLDPESHRGDPDIQYYTVYKTSVPGEIRRHTGRGFFMEFTSEEDEAESDPLGAD